jgi:hypothetical protein
MTPSMGGVTVLRNALALVGLWVIIAKTQEIIRKIRQSDMAE